MRGALRSTQPRTGRRAASSRIPCRAAVLDWLHTVDHTVAEWQPGAGTIHRLRLLAAHPWRPQDCELLDDHTTQLQQWAASAVEVLGDTVIVPLRGFACPNCNTNHVYRRRDGENVRSAALTVTEAGAECGNCGATWAVDQLEFLARLLGCAGAGSPPTPLGRPSGP